MVFWLFGIPLAYFFTRLSTASCAVTGGIFGSNYGVVSMYHTVGGVRILGS